LFNYFFCLYILKLVLFDFKFLLEKKKKKKIILALLGKNPGPALLTDHHHDWLLGVGLTERDAD
jgi:hypothetical protein